MRSTGFSFDWMDRLCTLVDSKELVRYEAASAEVERIEREIIVFTQDRVPVFVSKLQRRFKGRQPLKTADLATELREDLEELLDARNAHLLTLEESEPGLQDDFLSQLKLARESLVAFLSLPEAREALFLSNPEALQRIDSLIERGVDRIDNRTRQRIRLGWNYVQRFCAKNDTVSFFGPVAWGRFAEENAVNLSVKVSTPWLASRKTFFEHWVVQRLIKAICSDQKICDYLPLQLNPGCYVESDLLHYPLGRTRRLDLLGSALMEALQRAPAEGLTRQVLVERLSKKHYSITEVMGWLDFLTEKRVLIYAFAVSPGTPDPLSRLIQLIHSVGADDDSKAPWLTVLEDLEIQRKTFAISGLEGRVAALDSMRRLLSDSGVDLTRLQGQMYVGRFPVYEDCSRNLEIVVGGQLLGDIREQLEPIMALYRWLVGAVASRLHERYLRSWQALHSGKNACEPLDFLSFVSQLYKEDHVTPVTKEVREILRLSWSELTRGYKTLSEVSLVPEDLDRLLNRLDECEPRASQCEVLCKGVHSPDFMIAAKSLQDVERGEYKIVIGEVHPAVHTVSQPIAQPFCPYTKEVEQEVQELLSPRALVISDSPETYQRSHIDWLNVPALMQVILPTGGGHVDSARKVPSGGGLVVLDGCSLKYQDRGSGLVQDLLTVIPSTMHRICFGLAGELLGQVDDRRLTMDRIVLKRRSWYLTEDRLPEISEPSETLSGFLAWRRWASSVGLPRHVFVKCESEPKPVFVDFCNTFSLDLLASLSKKKEPMRISEMSPSPDELWLDDGRGRYCAEFRTSYVSKSCKL